MIRLLMKGFTKREWVGFMLSVGAKVNIRNYPSKATQN